MHLLTTSRSARRRSSTTGPARSSWLASGRSSGRFPVRPDPAGTDRRDDEHRGQDVLAERGLRPDRDPLGRGRSLTGKPRGASTITQQLVRNALLPEMSGRLDGSSASREIIQTIRLTQELPPGIAGKQQIWPPTSTRTSTATRATASPPRLRATSGSPTCPSSTSPRPRSWPGSPSRRANDDLVQNAVEMCSVQTAAGVACPAGKTVLEVPRSPRSSSAAITSSS